MKLIFVRIKMSLVPQFLTVLHHSAKVSVLNKCHAKFQGQTRNAFFPGPGGESEGGGAPLPLGSFQTCLAAHVYPSFIIKNNIISYNASSSQIDHYKKTVVIPLLDSLIVQTQDRFSDEDRHARHLLCVVPSLIVNKVLQLDDEVEGMLLWENEETKFSVTPSFVLTHALSD